MAEDPNLTDIGVGFRPDLTGRGQSRILLRQMLNHVDTRLGPVPLRAAIADWNTRALHATEHTGFRRSSIHSNHHGTYYIYIREPQRSADDPN
jgi:ribosomal-protein-alanine N-acetyltransferase